MSYLGAKSGSGVYQTIINLMPPHDCYVEPFLGSGAIMRMKPPALQSIGLDLDSDALRQFSEDNPLLECELFTTDAYSWLKNSELDDKTLIYCDPPYPHSTRTSDKRYKDEYTDDDHIALLAMLLLLDCRVMVSSYKNTIYDKMLSGWFSKSFQAMTRGGVRTETIWCNFNPSEISYHTFAGSDYTDRQRIKRKAVRWAKNFEKLAAGERQAVFAAILSAGEP